MVNIKKFGFVSTLFILGLILILPVMGADFSVNVTPNVTSTKDIHYAVVNLTITNNDTLNITQVVVYLINNPDIVFIPGNTSNGTSVHQNLYEFLNETGNQKLIWKNTTEYGIIENGSSEYFWFNTTLPHESGSYIITIETIDKNDTSVSINKTITIDNSAPVMTLLSPDNVRQTANNVSFNWSVSDFFDNVTCNLSIDGQVNKSGISVSTNGTHTEIVTGLTVGEHNWSVTCWDDFSNVNTSVVKTFGLYPDLIVSELTWEPQDARLNATSNITATVKIKNLGDFAINETYEKEFNESNTSWKETYYHKFNITLKLDGVVKIYASVNASMAAGNETVVFENVSIENIGLGDHIIRVDILKQDENGTFALEESNETNNYNETSVYAGYVVSVEINNVTDEQINENETAELKIQVNYSNGEPVSGLTFDNFTFGGYYLSSSYTPDVIESSFNDENASIGLYRINFTTPGITDGRAKPGIYNVTVTVTGKDSEGNITYRGTGKSYYELFAPDVSIELNADATEINIGDYVNFNFILKNNGNLNATGVVVKAYKVIGTGTVSVVNGILSETFCTTDVPAGSSVSCKHDEQNLKLKGTGIGDYVLGVDVNYTMGSKKYYFYTSHSIQIINTTTESNDNNENTAAPVLGGEGATCDSSKDCKSGYWCDNGFCRKLTQNVDIIKFPEKVEVVMGQSTTFEVEIKNTGVTVSLMKLTTTVDGIDVSIVPSSRALLQSETYTFMVTLDSGDTDVGKYQGTITAFVATDTSIKATKSFEVYILPTEEKKNEIKELYANYSEMFDKASQDFEHFKTLGFVNESDIKTVQVIYDAMKNTMDDIKNALDNDDYVTAYMSLKQFKNFYDQFNTELDNLEYVQTENMGEQWSGVWVWFVVGIIALGAGGFVTYKFILIEGYHPKFGYRPKSNIITQIKNNLNAGKGKLNNIKTKVNLNVKGIRKPFSKEPTGEKIAEYSTGYQKRYPFNYKYTGKSSFSNSLMRIKDFFKKKKSGKYLSDYYS